MKVYHSNTPSVLGHHQLKVYEDDGHGEVQVMLAFEVGDKLVDVQFVVDSGSYNTSMSYELARTLGLGIHDGSAFGWLDLNNGVMVAVPVFIEKLECDPLLGNDFINYYHVSLNMRDNQLVVRQPTAAIFATPLATPFVNMSVGGRRFKAVMDTGATKTYLTPYTARALKLDVITLL